MVEEQKQAKILDKYGREYPPRQPDGYIQPGLATDALVLRNKKTQILLITRGRGAYVGKLAFPGGKVDYGESPEAGCLRELSEECNFELEILKIARLIDVRGDPQRDPRKHMVSIIYEVDVPDQTPFKAGDDAAAAQFYNIEELVKDKSADDFAFDHWDILQNFVKEIK